MQETRHDTYVKKNDLILGDMSERCVNFETMNADLIDRLSKERIPCAPVVDPQVLEVKRVSCLF